MNKKLLILTLILSSLSFSGKKINIIYKSSVENEGKFNSIKYSKLKYKPVDLTVSTPNNEYSMNLILKGDRLNISYPTLASRYVTGLRESEKVELPENYKEYKFFYDYRIPEYKIFESNLFKDDKQTEIHSHDHNHDHNHEHNHEHGELIGETIEISAPQKRHIIKENNDFQAKINFEINKKKYGLKYIKYLTSYKEDDVRYQKNDGIIEGRYTYLFDDNLGITVVPRIVTREFKPAILEFNSYGRYKVNNNIFLGLDVYNGRQINLLNERKNYRNKISAYFDYNTEKKRLHEFWEVLDHEHDKIDQFKFKVSYDHTYNAKYNPLNFKILDNYLDTKKYDINLIVKKSNIGVKGLSISNDFKFNSEVIKSVDSDRKYLLKHRYYFKDNDDYENAFDFFGDLTINTLLQKNLGKSIEKIGNKYIVKNHFQYTPDDGYKPYEYYIITEVNSDPPKNFNKTKVKKLVVSNLTELEYVKSKDKVNLKNDFKFITNPENNEWKIYNDLTSSYERNFGYGIRLKFNILEKFEKYSFNGLNLYDMNELKTGFDLNHLYNENGIKIKTGLKFDGAMLARRAHITKLYGPNINPILRNELLNSYPDSPYLTQGSDEKDKWMLGQEYTIKPYIDFKYSPINNLDIKANLEIEKSFIKTPFRKIYNFFNPADKEFTSNPMMYKIGFGIDYKY
ncbi:hypothetical protein [Streptobacillus canis]|uniref:hypothetical protein n=1 Tax=Streptobacillus canis TaxID=2678686 RepID=UPI0012E1A36B|nr:hypothetical protein [Streptobacillus canis]